MLATLALLLTAALVFDGLEPALLIGAALAGLAVVSLMFIAGNLNSRLRSAAVARSRRPFDDESRCRRLIALLSGWYWEQDERYRFTQLSEEWFAGTGRDEGYFTGRTVWELPATGAADEQWEEHQTVLASRRSFRDFVVRWSDPATDVRYISLSGMPVYDGQGRFTGYHGIARDITAEKRATEELLESEHRFRRLTELTSDWYWEQDAGYRFTMITRNRETALRFSTTENIGKTRWELPYEDVSDEAWAQHKALLEAHRPFSDFVAKRRDNQGNVRYSCLSGEPMFSTDGIFVGYRGIGRDITDDVVKEKELRQAHQALRAVVERSPAAIYTLDLDGVVTMWNPAAERMFGWKESEVVNHTLPIVPAVKMVEFNKLMAKVRGGVSLRNVELVRQRRDGSRIDINVSTAPLYDSEGGLTGILSLASDVSDRKRAEARQSVAYAVSRLLAQSDTPALAIKGIVRAICEYLGWACGAYWRLYGQEQLLQCSQAWSVQSPAVEEFLEYSRIQIDNMQRSPQPEDGGVVRRVWLSGDPYWGVDITRDRAFHRAPDAKRAGLHSSLAFPVKSGDIVFGVMEFFSFEVRQPDAELLRTARVIGNQLGLFLRRKQSEARQSMGHAVTGILAESTSTREAIPRIVATVCDTLGWDYGAHWQMDSDTETLICVENWSVPSTAVRRFADHSRTQSFTPGPAGLIRRAAAERTTIWIADIADESSFVRAPLAKQAGLHSAFAFPMILNKKCTGVMEFFGHEIQQPDHWLLQSLEAIGRQIGQFCKRNQAEKRMHFLAYHDALTSLPNRLLLGQLLNHALARARRNDCRLGVLFIDLDRFKNINDTLGHERGDRVLQGMAKRIKTCLRETDTVARQGGDEFIVLLEDLYLPWDASKVARQLLAAVAEPMVVDGREFNLTASIGISTYPNDGSDARALLKHADIAMYRAKECGKNNFQLYSAHMTTRPLRLLELESGLRRAIAGDQLTIHYQPRLSIESGAITGVEALIRWRHPDKGLILPDTFIPLAEEVGLIVPIGRWVLETACDHMASWLAQGMPAMRLAINLSARQFSDGRLLRDIQAVIDNSGISATQLEFEITESMLMRQPEHTAQVLLALKEKGPDISIDDFGTAYSSLNYLKRFPIDIVKIDRTFIRDIPAASDDVAITQAIITMAHDLNLHVIAEGVENVEQLECLRGQGCDEFQGFYFSKPVPQRELVRLVHGHAPAPRACVPDKNGTND